MHHFGAGHSLEQFHEQMVWRTRTAGAERQLARIVLGIFDQIGDRLHRQRWRDHQDEWHIGDERQWHKILGRVIGQLSVQRGVDGERRAGAHQQRVAIRLRLGHHVRGQHRSSAGPVIGHEAFAETLLQPTPKHAGEDVGGATWGVGTDDGRCPRRIILCGGRHK